MKLSKAQLELLKILHDEDTTVVILRAVRGNPITYITSRVDKRMRSDTVLKLAKLGLLENVTEEEWRWREWEYRITEAGKAIIKTAKEEEAE